MDKENVAYPETEYYLAVKRMSMTETWKHYSEWKKPDTEGHFLYDSIYIKRPQ